MENPLESLLTEDRRGTDAVTARVHMERGSELEVFGLLKGRGIMELSNQASSPRIISRSLE